MPLSNESEKLPFTVNSPVPQASSSSTSSNTGEKKTTATIPISHIQAQQFIDTSLITQDIQKVFAIIKSNKSEDMPIKLDRSSSNTIPTSNSTSLSTSTLALTSTKMDSFTSSASPIIASKKIARNENSETTSATLPTEEKKLGWDNIALDPTLKSSSQYINNTKNDSKLSKDASNNTNSNNNINLTNAAGKKLMKSVTAGSLGIVVNHGTSLPILNKSISVNNIESQISPTISTSKPTPSLPVSPTLTTIVKQSSLPSPNSKDDFNSVMPSDHHTETEDVLPSLPVTRNSLNVNTKSRASSVSSISPSSAPASTATGLRPGRISQASRRLSANQGDSSPISNLIQPVASIPSAVSIPSEISQLPNTAQQSQPLSQPTLGRSSPTVNRIPLVHPRSRSVSLPVVQVPPQLQVCLPSSTTPLTSTLTPINDSAPPPYTPFESIPKSRNSAAISSSTASPSITSNGSPTSNTTTTRRSTMSSIQTSTSSNSITSNASSISSSLSTSTLSSNVQIPNWKSAPRRELDILLKPTDQLQSMVIQASTLVLLILDLTSANNIRSYLRIHNLSSRGECKSIVVFDAGVKIINFKIIGSIIVNLLADGRIRLFNLFNGELLHGFSCFGLATCFALDSLNPIKDENDVSVENGFILGVGTSIGKLHLWTIPPNYTASIPRGIQSPNGNSLFQCKTITIHDGISVTSLISDGLKGWMSGNAIGEFHWFQSNGNLKHTRLCHDTSITNISTLKQESIWVTTSQNDSKLWDLKSSLFRKQIPGKEITMRSYSQYLILFFDFFQM